MDLGINLNDLIGAPCRWQGVTEGWTSSQKRDAISELSFIAERAAQFAEYVSGRYGYGCGDQGHEDSVKQMNKVGKKVKCDAMGYNAYHPLSLQESVK